MGTGGARVRYRVGARSRAPAKEIEGEETDVSRMGNNNGDQLTNGNGGRAFASFREIADFLWQNAERLRGAYKPNEYDRVILPLLVVRRLDCVLDPTKAKVLTRLDALEAKGMKAADAAVDVALRKVAGVPFYNTSKLDFERLKGDPNHIAQNLRAYLEGFSQAKSSVALRDEPHPKKSDTPFISRPE